MPLLPIEIFVSFFAGALALSVAAERLGIPAPVLLVLAGLGIHRFFGVQVGFDFGPTLLFIFLPPLIFEGAWSLDLAAVRLRQWRVLYLALPGTLLTAFLVALGVVHQPLTWAAAALFGAIISATDPVAVVSVFRRVNIPGTVKTIVEAESLANDGIAVVLYALALSVLDPTPGSHTLTWVDYLVHPLLQIVGASIVGIISAGLTWLALRSTDASDYEVAMTVVLAYVSYLTAERFHCSGIIATTCSAVALRSLLRRSKPTLIHRDNVNVFWNTSATLVNTFLFFTTGLIIDPIHIFESPLLVLMAFIGMLLSRGILALTAATSLRARLVVFMAGMRGSLPLALALSLPHEVAQREIIINGVAACVLLSLCLNGIPLEPMIRYVYRDDHRSA